jgi:hypothetical protein
MSNLISSGLKSTQTINEFVTRPVGNKFRGVAGEEHVVYYPKRADGKDLMGLTFNMHSILGIDGKERSIVCTKDIINLIPKLDDKGKPVLGVDNETVMVSDPKLDGTCPICERTGDATEIYQWQLEDFKSKLREAQVGITEKEVDAIVAAKQGVRAYYTARRYASYPDPKIFAVVLSAKLTGDKGNPIELRADGTPNIKLSLRAIAGRARGEGLLSYVEQTVKGLNKAESIEAESNEEYEPKTIENMGGAEVVFEFPNTDKENYMRMMGDAYKTQRIKRLGQGYFDKRADVIKESKRLIDGFDAKIYAESFPELKDANVQDTRAQLNSAFAGFDAWRDGGRVGTLRTGMEEYAIPQIETSSEAVSNTSAPKNVLPVIDIPMEGESITDTPKQIAPPKKEKKIETPKQEELGSSLDFDDLDDSDL